MNDFVRQAVLLARPNDTFRSVERHCEVLREHISDRSQGFSKSIYPEINRLYHTYIRLLPKLTKE